MLHPARRETWVSLGAGSALDRCGGGWKGRGILLSHKKQALYRSGSGVESLVLQRTPLFCSDRKVVEESRGKGTENAVSLGLGFYFSLFFRTFCNSVSQVYPVSADTGVPVPLDT